MPTSELRVPQALSPTLQNVQDEASTDSALQIATNAVQVTPAATLAPGHPSFIVNAPASTENAPAIQVNSQSAESAIRFFTADGAAYHIGIGGGAGRGSFFFFSGKGNGVIVMTIDEDGNVTINKNLSIGGQLTVGSLTLDASQFTLLNVPPATAALKHLVIDPATGKIFAH